jgi:hypothetical protein
MQKPPYAFVAPSQTSLASTMASKTFGAVPCLTLLLLLAQSSASVSTLSSPSSFHHEHKPPHQPKTTYIVHTDHLTKLSHFATLGHWYASMVSSLSTTADSSRVFYVLDNLARVARPIHMRMNQDIINT